MLTTESNVLPRTARRQIPGLRWLMISLIFLATMINYVDRQSVSLLKPVLSDPKVLGLSAAEYSYISTFMLFAYMLSQSISGKFYDRYGSKVGFTVSIIIWSLAAMGQSMIAGFYSFAALAFVLGFGEAGNWPGSAKVVAEWFPVRERARGMAIFNSGAAMGSVVAPPLIVWLQLELGWRHARIITGGLGLIWLIAWLLLFHTPETHPNITPDELVHIRAGLPFAAQNANPFRGAFSCNIVKSGALFFRAYWSIRSGGCLCCGFPIISRARAE